MMKRLILTALVVVGLMGVALPGTVMAAKGGNSAAAQDCREDFESLGFKNRGDCVSFFAQGGTLNPFRLACAANGGAFFPTGLSQSQECDVSALDGDTRLELLFTTFRDVCVGLGFDNAFMFGESSRIFCGDFIDD